MISVSNTSTLSDDVELEMPAQIVFIGGDECLDARQPPCQDVGCSGLSAQGNEKPSGSEESGRLLLTTVVSGVSMPAARASA